MISGAPEEGRWTRAEPRRELAAPVVEQMIRTAFPACRVVDTQPLEGGFRNANFKVRLDHHTEPIVLRVYEHDAALCQKEVDILELVGGPVPVPEVIHAEPTGVDGSPPFVVMRFAEGTSFGDLERAGSNETMAQAAYSAGEALAAIGRFTFPKSGWLSAGPTVTDPLLEGPNPMPRFIDLCLASEKAGVRMPTELRDRTHEVVWSRTSELAELGNEKHLVHGDFGANNILMAPSNGRWSVVAVLDWEFAVSGSPLADIGHFLRYECDARPVLEPHFSRGYLSAGGTLPQDWRRLARLVDLAALCEILTREHLTSEVLAELFELVKATVEDRDPVLI